MTSSQPPDIELFLTTYLRDNLPNEDNLQIDIHEPDNYNGTYPLITIRNDDGEKDEFNRYTFDIAINIQGWDRTNSLKCKTLANKVFSLLMNREKLLKQAGSPVLTINEDNSTLPHAITTNPNRAHYYFVIALATVGEIVD